MDPKERNRIQLKKGLQNLPAYAAPDHNWEAIQQQMDQAKKDVVLQEALKALPTHDAPDHIWANIEVGIQAGKAKVRRLSILRWASAAMLVGLCAIWIFRTTDQPLEYAEAIKYEQIELSPVAWTGDQPEVAQHVNTVLAAARAQDWEQPKMKALQGSLEQISSAIAQVEAAGAQMGMNDQMRQQLTKMFIKRNQLVRQLAAEI